MQLNKYYLLASASTVALSGGASAADLPLKAPPPVLAPTWTGFYIGGHLGAAWQQAHTDGTGYDFLNLFDRATLPVSNTLSQTGFLGGAQIGYDWQYGNAVFGLKADISGLTGRASGFQQIRDKNRISNITTTNKIDWLSTFRGNIGLAVGNAMAYVTGGVAVGHVSNQHSFACSPLPVNLFNCSSQAWTDNSTKAGLVAGAGAAVLLDPHWEVRGEALWVNLRQSTGSPVFASPSVALPPVLPPVFNNQAVIVRAELDYRFP
jgi:outer membrane immunogenic protein